MSLRRNGSADPKTHKAVASHFASETDNKNAESESPRYVAIHKYGERLKTDVKHGKEVGPLGGILPDTGSGGLRQVRPDANELRGRLWRSNKGRSDSRGPVEKHPGFYLVLRTRHLR